MSQLKSNLIEFPNADARQLVLDKIIQKAAPGDRLLTLCREYVNDNEIYSEETIYQTDRVAETSIDFVADICKIVGFAVYDDGPTPKRSA